MEKVAPTRRALEDASNRVNQSPAKATGQKTAGNNPQSETHAPKPQTFEEHKAFVTEFMATEAADPNRRALGHKSKIEREAPTSTMQPTAAPTGAKQSNAKSNVASSASSSKKRKAEMSLEDEVAAYKQNLDDVISTNTFEDDRMPSCQAVRNRINKMLDAGIMTKAEFSRALGSRNGNNLSNFLKQKGPFGGCNSAVYYNAWAWFRQREVAKLKMPDMKKRQMQEANATSYSAEGSASKTAPANATSLPDISNIHLEGEETDNVSVWDTCDEIRRKINAHLKTPGLTQAQFCRDLYAQLHQPKCKSIQSKQLADFRGQKGPRTGAKSTVFYAAYVYFEKLRIAQGKPKSKHREDMEDIWGLNGGFDREADHRTMFIVRAEASSLHFDKYGRTISV